VHVCGEAVSLNARLVSADQNEYHESLRQNFTDMAERLGEIFGETVSILRQGIIYEYNSCHDEIVDK